MKKTIILLLCCVLLTSVFSGCGKAEELTTMDFQVFGCETFGESAAIHAAVEFGAEEYKLELGKNADLANAFYKYSDDFRLIASFDSKNKLVDYSIVDAATGEDLGKLDAEGMYKAFDIEAKYECVEAEYPGSIRISQMEENKLYKYTVEEGTDFYPENDTDKNVIVYFMDSEYRMQETALFFGKYAGTEPEFMGFYAFSDTVYFRWVSLDADNFVECAGEEKAVFLSNYAEGDTIELVFEECFINDTDREVTLTGMDESVTAIAPGELCGVDWMGFGMYTVG